MEKVVVIGAGQAGSSCVAKLRSGGFTGSITLIGEESAPPYQRPPLSKKYLLGDMALERLYLRPESYYAENGIDLHLSQTAVSIDRADRKVVADGHSWDYDRLVLATGSVSRRLPPAIGGLLDGVYCMRDLKDADAMAPLFQPGKNLLVVGGGYIGLEAAAVAAQKGLNVTLVEMADRILQRVAAPQTSDFFRDLHIKHGVRIIEGTGLDTLLGEGHVTGARLSDGTELKVDFAIVGIGITPATELAKAAGLEIDNGIKTDSFGRTSDPHIWSAGDCASFPYKGDRLRLESVGNAIDQGEIVAENIMGAETPYTAKPWFWSDQYDCKLQIAGLNAGYDRIVTRQGADGSVSYWYYKGETLLALDAMNDPRAYMVGKRLIENGKSPNPTLIADPAQDLKPLLKA